MSRDYKTLEEILIWVMGCTDDIPDEDEKEDLEAAKHDIVELFKRLVPAPMNEAPDFNDGGDDECRNRRLAIESAKRSSFNDCRNQMLRKIESATATESGLLVFIRVLYVQE